MTHNGQSNRTEPVLLAWTPFIFSILVGGLGLGLFIINRTTPVPATWGSAAGTRTGLLALTEQVFIFISFGVLGPLIGALIAARDRRQPIGWLLSLAGLGYSVVILVGELTVYTNFTDSDRSGGLWVGWVMNWIWVFPSYTMLLIIALFPDGRPPTGRWRWSIRWLAFSLALMAGASFVEDPMGSAFGLDNPLAGLTPSTASHGLYFSAIVFFVLTPCWIAWQTVSHFRQARGDKRQQFKWLAATALLAVLFIVVGTILSFGFNLVVGQVMANISLGFPILGIGLAILRYRLYEIDIIIRRSLIYVIVSGLLAFVYFGSVLVTQSVFHVVTGRAENSQLIIVLSTLIIAALFNPLRHRVQTVINRRFYRQSYDAAITLAHFAATARDEVDLENLTRELVRIVDETMQPTHVSLWLKQNEGSSK